MMNLIIEDDAKSMIFGIVLGLVVIVGIFMDWSSGAEDSFYALDSSGAPSFFNASSEDKKITKKQDIKSSKKQDIEPAKQLNSLNYFDSTKPPQSVDLTRKGN